MSQTPLPLRICALYAFSLLLSLAVLVLSLLDLGFGSLFLGIVGPCVTYMHHGCTALMLRKSGTMSVSLIVSTSNIVTVGVLGLAWIAGSIVVTLWGTFYIDGSAQVVTQVAGTAGTVLAQGIVGVLESIVLILLFVTLVCVRRAENPVEEESVDSCGTLHRSFTSEASWRKN